MSEFDNLEKELSQFTGTQNYCKNFLGLLYTEGINFLAEKVGAYWLIDAVSTYQPKLKKQKVNFQLWKLKILSRKLDSIGNQKEIMAVLECREDSNTPVIVSHDIPFTNFPLENFEFYVVDNVMLLKSEY